jgi:serine/threonine-protein kinase RIO1
MTPGTEGPDQGDAQAPFYDNVLQRVRRVMAEDYGLRSITIRAVGSKEARLSIPIVITGIDKSGGRGRYFGKIMGHSDLLSAHSIQMFKNLYLRMNKREPIFGVSRTVEDMVRAQYETLQAIHRTRIPTSRPYGYHLLDGVMWLLVIEYLEAKPISGLKELDLGQVDTAFRHLRAMHLKRIYHGDIKPDNIMVDDRVYILDIGQFDEDAPAAKKRAYDLASMTCSFLGRCPVEDIVRVAGKHNNRKQLRAAADYIELVQRRPDFHFSDETKDRLVGLLREPGSARASRKRARKAEAKSTKGRRGRFRLRRAPE